MKFVQRLAWIFILSFSLIATVYLASYYEQYFHELADTAMSFQLQRSLATWLIKLEKSEDKYLERQVIDTKKIKTIGVWGSRGIGKWYGNFTCPKSGETVYVIQSTDLKILSKCDALLLMYGPSIPWHALSSQRPRGQIWIYMSFESVRTIGVGNAVHIRSNIDWTFTYSSGATFPSPYGAFYPFNQSRPSPEPETRNWAKSKAGLVCSMVSNCNAGWPRMKLIRELSTYVSTHMYGDCGGMQCQRKATCNKMLSKYKFYLAFENSLCGDYITEKFWYNALAFDIVPIVYGARQEDYKRVAPPNSYIHVKNFSSIHELAEYVQLLDKRDDLYNRYFEWKRQGYIKSNLLAEHYEPNITMCRILEQLNKVRHINSTSAGKMHNSEVNGWLNSCE